MTQLDLVHAFKDNRHMNKKINVEAAKNAMASKGLTQSAIAEAIGVTKEAVSQWFLDKSFPKPAKLLQLGKLLGLSLNQLVETADPNMPRVAFRKMANRKTTHEHIAKAQGMGMLLRHLAPNLPFDADIMPPVLSSPRRDYEYLQKIALKVRKDINISADAVIDFNHLIKRFNDLHAVIVPVLWGSKNRHENAVHIYLPDSKSTWVYLNLDTKIFDFKFWMAHELGHCLSPTLEGEEAEDFADAFAGALLFPESKAKVAYEAIMSAPSDTARYTHLFAVAQENIISPYTVFKEINHYAKHAKLYELELANLGARITNFNKRYLTVSEVLFDGEEITAKRFIDKSKEAFDTPFYDVLGQYLRSTKKGAGVINGIMDMPIMDAHSILSELT